MNQHINALLGPLEGATRSGDWEDAEDIAREISRLARMERLKELQRIQEAIEDHSALMRPVMAPKGSQGANPPLPVNPSIPIHLEKRQVSASELSENLKDPAWTTKAKAAGWDTDELRKAAAKALPATPPDPIKQGESTPIGFHVEQWPFG